MAQEFLGLRTVIYKVSDIEEAKAWYQQVLGFAPYFDQPFYVGFNVGGYELGLHPGELTADEKTESVNAYWGVEDVEATFHRLISLGAMPHEDPTNVGDDIVVAAVIDPWGNIFGMIYNPHFK